LNKQAINEIEEALSSPNCTVDTLLRCGSLTSQFRNNNPGLITFLQKEENLKRIFEIIHTSDDKKIQKSILSLFQTSNTILHHSIAYSLPLSEYIIDALEDQSCISRYSFGIFSRILSRAFDIMPDEMSEIFRVSTKIYPTIIRNINNLCMFKLVQDLITDQHRGIWLFLWYEFLSIIPEDERNEYNLPKREAIIRSSVPIPYNLITPTHRQNILENLKSYFKLRHGTDEEFEISIKKYINSQSSIDYLLYSVALYISPDENIKENAIKTIINSKDSPEIEECFEYISHSYSIDDMDTIIKLFFCVLTSENITNFILASAKNLFISFDNYLYQESQELHDSFQKQIINILMYTYNTSNRSNHIIIPYVLTFCIRYAYC